MIHDRPGAVPFVKGHGTENDFVVLPDLQGVLELTPGRVAALCDRRAGLGADGVLRVVPAALDPDAAPHADEAHWFMDYRNADGSLAQMCGNGIRVFGRYLVAAGLAPTGELRVVTRDGLRRLQVPPAGDVTVDMGPATLRPDPVTVAVAGRRWDGVAVDAGNPHAVAFVDDLADAGRLLDAPSVGPDHAFPDGVNVEFVVDRGPAHVAFRVFERGVGETRSCGTGACAVVAAARARGGADPDAPWTVDVPGGRLHLTVAADGGLAMSGPAVLVAEGEILPQWWEEQA